jgi:hypothetical protein
MPISTKDNTMKPIKLVPKNMPLIQAALDAANGRATEHTITSAAMVQSIAMDIEKRLLRFVQHKMYLPGASAVRVSGSAITSAYKYSRYATTVCFEFRKAGVYITDVRRTSIGGSGGGTNLTLTPEQDGCAIRALRDGYSVVGGTKHWVGPTGDVTVWGAFDDESAARAAFALVSGGAVPNIDKGELK